MPLKIDYNLKKLNTFGIDVSAKYFQECSSVDEIRKLLFCDEFRKNNHFVLGGGSNVLFTRNYGGFILKPNIQGIEIIDESEKNILLRAYSGVIWDDFVKYCVSKNFYGAENLSWIPGVVGAVPVQNIGAYGAEAKDIIHKVSALEIESGEEIEFDNSQCHFGYRDSIFKKEFKDKFIIVSVDFLLSKHEKYNLEYHTLKNRIDSKKINLQNLRKEIINIRKSKLPNPNQLGNAGSFFKNPIVNEKKFLEIREHYSDVKYFILPNKGYKISAAWLIEKCGWKGQRNGGVGIFSKQALVIVNFGGANGEEVLKFSKKIKENVYDKFRINLIEEVTIIPYADSNS
jgi:UDP-N-acetylmuramate dehydrogenase